MIVGAKVLFDLRHDILSLSALLDAKHWMRGGMWGGLLAYLVLAVPVVSLLSRKKRAALDLVAQAIPMITERSGTPRNRTTDHGPRSSRPMRSLS